MTDNELLLRLRYKKCEKPTRRWPKVQLPQVTRVFDGVDYVDVQIRKQDFIAMSERIEQLLRGRMLLALLGWNDGEY